MTIKSPRTLRKEANVEVAMKMRAAGHTLAAIGLVLGRTRECIRGYIAIETRRRARLQK